MAEVGRAVQDQFKHHPLGVGFFLVCVSAIALLLVLGATSLLRR